MYYVVFALRRRLRKEMDKKQKPRLSFINLINTLFSLRLISRRTAYLAIYDYSNSKFFL